MTPLAEQLVAEFRPHTERACRAISRDDEALSAGYEALCLAAEKWRPGCGVAAKSFIMGRVRQAAKRAVLWRGVTNWDSSELPDRESRSTDLSFLPPHLEAPARLVWVDGYTRLEAAEMLGITLDEVRYRLGVVAEKMREFLPAKRRQVGVEERENAVCGGGTCG